MSTETKSKTNKKLDITMMTTEELEAYVEAVRAKRRINSKKFYDEKIKTDPEKMAKHRERCREPNIKYYYSKKEIV